MVAPVLGFVSVGLASAAAGQASAALARWRRDGRAFDAERWKSFVQVDDLALDALIGAALFMARARVVPTHAELGSALTHELRLRLWAVASAPCCRATFALWCVSAAAAAGRAA